MKTILIIFQPITVTDLIEPSDFNSYAAVEHEVGRAFAIRFKGSLIPLSPEIIFCAFLDPVHPLIIIVAKLYLRRTAKPAGGARRLYGDFTVPILENARSRCASNLTIGDKPSKCLGRTVKRVSVVIRQNVRINLKQY